ncbi:MAG TPA: hypothetical protein VJ691_11980 [Vicinamibacterales bacterium]|nr:hypothetical protein [Vicinamibacterales bacterium]
MHRSGLVLVAAVAVLQPDLIATQGDKFTVSQSPVADVRQETLQEINPESKQPVEVFPGTYKSPYGAMVMKRIEEMLARVDEADRKALVDSNIGAGFDRAITSWRAHPAGRTVALAVSYYRDHVLKLKVALSDDYGRPEPIVTADYQFATIAVCSRAAAGWTCREDELTALAKKHNLSLPTTGAARDATVAKILELMLAEK